MRRYSINGSKTLQKSLLSVLTIFATVISYLLGIIIVNADDTTEDTDFEGLSIHYMDGSLDERYQTCVLT